MSEAELEFVTKLSETGDPLSLAVDLRMSAEKMVNNFGFNPEKIVDAVFSAGGIARDRLIAMAGYYVDGWGQVLSHCFDGRNEKSGEMCREIRKMDGFGKILQAYEDHKELAECFMGETRYMHKTLMQTLTGLMLCVLDYAETPVRNELKRKYPYTDWWRMPLI